MSEDRTARPIVDERHPSDYYAFLGVPREAVAEEIRVAYRRLARQHHPDVNPPDEDDRTANEFMCRLNEAYFVLSDPERRRDYDQKQVSGAGASPGSAQTPFAGSSFRPPVGWSYADDWAAPAWMERLYQLQVRLENRIKVYAPLLDMLAPVLVLAVLLILGFGISLSFADHPLVRFLGIDISDIFSVIIIAFTMIFVPFWLLLKFRR